MREFCRHECGRSKRARALTDLGRFPLEHDSRRRLLRRVILCVRWIFLGFLHSCILLYPAGEFLRFSVCVSLTYRWTSLSDGDRCSLRWRLTNPFRRRTSRAATYRRLHSHLASLHRTRSSNSSKTFSSALKPWRTPWGSPQQMPTSHRT